MWEKKLQVEKIEDSKDLDVCLGSVLRKAHERNNKVLVS